MDQVFLDDSVVAEVEARLTVFEVPMLFAMTTDSDIVLESTLTAPRIVKRAEDRARATDRSETQ